ncbi:neutral cholesterol ester hydrolase 1a isoform X2 [Poeciliopsis prolifica]|uniref:neutral cholesterol ester hydrolase 1a isoform X2 n=1 Tax=Poeciliopsis prolifica TaxID=188132 RepID=UPI00241345DB|nr:neutral cholesterol ester hydrolase 1a isoform X2 [Poeciliopsis prolifica]
MGLKAVVVTVLLAAALSYYIYTPVPDAIQQPWKLMAVDAAFRTVRNLAALKYHLGTDHYITSFRRTMEGLDSTMVALMGSRSPAGVVPGVKISDITFASIPVRVYEPPAGGEGHLRRGLMYLHGGGWAFGSGKMGAYDKVSRMISDELNTVVVSVEYRLFPEVLFPEPFLDCVAAAKHFLSPEVLDKYAIDPERVAVSGDSAGGNLAAAVAQENRDMAILPRQVMVQFWLQYLGADISLQPQLIANNHSALQHSALTPELRSRLDWTSLLSQKFKKSYKPVVVERDSHGLLKKIPGLLDTRSSPLLAGPEVLAKCPRTYILTCEFDVLRDDGLMYARRLKDAGVSVTSDYYEDGFHGCLTFTSWPLDFDVGKRALRSYMTWLQNNL